MNSCAENRRENEAEKKWMSSCTDSRRIENETEKKKIT